jgi:hypothetical protein
VAIDTVRFDKHLPGQNLYGAYASFTDVLPKSTFQPYLLWKTLPHVKSEEGVPGSADVYTVGFRWVGKLPAGFDYATEMAKQMGHFLNDDVVAWAGYWIVGCSVPRVPLKPRLSVEYDYATGDKGRGDGRIGTFDQLYPTNHPYYGIVDMEGWRNLKDFQQTRRVGQRCNNVALNRNGMTDKFSIKCVTEDHHVAGSFLGRRLYSVFAIEPELHLVKRVEVSSINNEMFLELVF